MYRKDEGKSSIPWILRAILYWWFSGCFFCSRVWFMSHFSRMPRRNPFHKRFLGLTTKTDHQSNPHAKWTSEQWLNPSHLLYIGHHTQLDGDVNEPWNQDPDINQSVCHVKGWALPLLKWTTLNVPGSWDQRLVGYNPNESIIYNSVK